MNGEHLRVKKPLTLRLFKRVLVFSALLIVLLSGARAWWEYQGTLAAVQEEFAVIESTKAKSVAASLWDYDREQLALHVEGIHHFHYITYVGVRDASGVVAQSGVKRTRGVLDREFPLSMVYNGQRQELGVLHVQADLESLRQAAWRTAWRVLAFNAALVLLVAGLIFWLTNSMISRHLAAFAAHLSAYSLGGENRPLTLDKKSAGDELDVLASALNTMQTGLSASYGQVLAAQAEVRSLARFPQENPSPVLRVRAGGQLLAANPASAGLLAHLGVQVGQALPEEYAAIIARALDSGEIQRFETGFGGQTFALVASPVSAEGFVNIYGLDITERKAAENALRKSEAILQAAMDQSQAGIAIADAPSGRLRYMNRAGLLIRGADEAGAANGVDSNQYVAGWKVLDLDGRPLEMSEVPLARAVMFGETSAREFIIRRAEGDDRIVWANAAPILDERGQVSAGIVVFLDITKRKEAEEALRKSEETFRAMIESAPLAIYMSTGMEQTSTYVNPTFTTLFGYTLEDVPNAACWWPLAYPDPEYRRQVVEEWTRRIARAIEARTAIEPLEVVCTCKDGSQKTVSWGFMSLDGLNYAYGLDLTERKRAEEALRRQVLALTQPLDSPASMRFTELFNLEDIQRIQDTFAESMSVASIITTPDGVPITKPSNFCRLCSDIIRKTDKGLANCYASDAVIGSVNMDGPTIKPCLSGGLWDAGASINVGGQHIANWLIGQVRNEALNEDAMLRYADDIGADRTEFKAALAEVPVMSSAQFGKVARALFLMSSELSLRAYQNAQQARFIHERKQAEEEVRRNNVRLQCLVRVLQHKAESVQEFLDYSLAEALKLTESRLGYIYHYNEKRREFVLNTWSREVMAECAVKGPQKVYALDNTGIWGEAVRQRRPLIVNDFQAATPLKRGYPEGHVELDNFMTVPVLRDGRIVAVAGVANKSGGYQEADMGQFSLLMDACWQVVGRLDAENSVLGSLHEKEILLKEIHHRVKNNLQIISSLLFLQAEYVVDPQDRTMFEESQKRISAMALVHEELYGSADLSSVDMGDYVPRLVERVVAGADVPVQVVFDVEDMPLPVTRSIPCGLVLNEMVMNAVKHAFRNGREGRLLVSLARRQGQVELAVEDNGPGLPQDFSLESASTLGLNLITSLASQLAGSVAAQNVERGARFALHFPVEES